MHRCVLRWICVVSLLCLAPWAAPLQAQQDDQQIPVEVLKQIKAATTLVKVRFEKGEGSGTGFLVATEGTTGFLVTNVRVIAPLEVTAPKILVTPQSTFDAPTPQWTPMMLAPRPKRGPTPPRSSMRRPSGPNIPRPGMPRSPTVRSQPGYRGSSGMTVRVQLVPGRIQVLLPQSIDVVFDSGRKTERTASATVAAIDLDHNLAVLKIQNVVDMPKPITPPEELDLLETTPVYVFGFPFGKQLSTGSGNPAMTVGSGTISSIRDDDEGDTQVVQIDGDINPGNSGGPVVDVKGQLIGLAVAGISETNIGLAVPATDLTKMLAGRVGGVRLTHSTPESGVAKVDVELKLIDPLHKIKKAVVRYRPTEELPPVTGNKKEGEEDDDVAPLPGAQELEMKIEDQKATGSITIKADGKPEKKYTVQAVYALADKKMILLPPAEPYAVKFQTKPPVAVAMPPANGVAAFTPSPGGPSLEDKFKAATPGGKVSDPKTTTPSTVTPPATTPPAVATPVARSRKWTDISGTFSVEAELIEVKDGKARLKRSDGTIVTVPTEKLCDEDLKFLSQRAAGQ